jgi:hypothetical protein
MRQGGLRVSAAAAAVIALLPASAHADQVAGSTANASTAALSLSVTPTALLSVPQATVAQLPASLRTLLATALQPIVVHIDGANASASRTAAVADLVSGHSDATPISLDVASLGTLLSELHTVLATAGSNISLPSLQSALSDVATITGNSTVMALLPGALATQLNALNQQLASLTAQLAALSSDTTATVDALQTTLAKQVGAQLQYVTGLQADIDATHPTGQTASQSALTVPPQFPLPAHVPTPPVLANLAPFNATALTAVGASQAGAAGPQASSNESTSKIDVGPAMDLSNLAADVTTIQGLLSQANASIATIAPQLPGVAAIINTALPGGLNLGPIGAQVTAAVGPAGVLGALVTGLGLNRLLSCSTLGTSSCAIASTSVRPEGTGLHAIATSKLVDIQALPIDAGLAASLSVLGASAGTPLLDVQGVQASSDAFIDGGNGSQTTTGSVTHIGVAGLSVIDNGQFNKPALSGHVPQPVYDALPGALPVGEPVTLPIITPAGTLTLQITLGAPQYTYTGSAHRSASLGRMSIRLLNGTDTGANPVTRFGASGAGPLVVMDTATVSSEVLGTSVSSGSGGPGTPGSLVPAGDGNNTTMGQTGLFGPSSLVVGLGLLGLGMLLRRRSRRPA